MKRMFLKTHLYSMYNNGELRICSTHWSIQYSWLNHICIWQSNIKRKIWININFWSQICSCWWVSNPWLTLTLMPTLMRPIQHFLNQRERADRQTDWQTFFVKWWSVDVRIKHTAAASMRWFIHSVCACVCVPAWLCACACVSPFQ